MGNKSRFDGWTFDPESGDLERNGVRSRLQDQPSRVLRELILRPGQLVTREQLIAMLWPKGVVDFDASLNTVVRKIRLALADVAEIPRYIETLPRRGYRFIGAMEPQPDGEHRPSIASQASPSAATRVAPARVAICVLPFSNLSRDVESEAFSDGITADIITELSRWRLLDVRSRSASFKYRGFDVDIGRVAGDLGVRFVVEGSIRRMEGRVRINVQLIDAASGRQVWANRYDRAQAEIFVLQDEVVQKIVGTLVGRVQASDVQRAQRKHPASLESYECVLNGNALPWDDAAAAAEAMRLFEKAIELDAGYGLAHALLGIMRCHAWTRERGEATDTLDEAYRLATRAVSLDDGESTCHSLLALICLYRRNFEPALRHIGRAVELNPNNPWNVADMAIVLGYCGELDQALEWSARAAQIDPYFDPPWHWRHTGRTYLMLNRFQESLATLEHIPVRTWRDSAYMAACHARLGDVERTRALLAQCMNGQPDCSLRQLMKAEPFKLASDADRFAQSLRLAGLPE